MASAGILQRDTDRELRSQIQAVEGRPREPFGRTFHIHQLDGARLEAMVSLDPAGVRIEWVHGKGDCAITGSGASILSLLRGGIGADEGVADGTLVLYGDGDLVRMAPAIFSAVSTV